MHRCVFKLTSEIYFSIQILDLRGQAELEQVQAVNTVAEVKRHIGKKHTKSHFMQCFVAYNFSIT